MTQIESSRDNVALSSDKLYIYDVQPGVPSCRTIDFSVDVPTKTNEGTQPLADCMALAPHAPLIALCVQKTLLFYDTKNLNLLSCTEIEKTATSVQFFHKRHVLLVADRSGYVSFYMYTSNGELTKEDGSLGHNSMLTDALITPDDDFVITSDRDEKIRVTHYPNVYNIASYCLGHNQFVSSLNFLPTDPRILVSVAGDGTCRLWNFSEGKQLCMYEDSESAPFVKCVVVQDAASNLAAIQKYNSNDIVLLSITGDISSGLSAICKSVISTNAPMVRLGTLRSMLLYLVDCETPLHELVSYQSKDELPEGFIADVSKSLSSVPIYNSRDTYQILFKREFDNVQMYHERKRARLVAKCQ